MTVVTVRMESSAYLSLIVAMDWISWISSFEGLCVACSTRDFRNGASVRHFWMAEDAEPA